MNSDLNLLVKAVNNLSRLNSPVHLWELFDGKDWPEFKRGMEAQARLLSMTPGEELQWLVARMSPRVKAVWAEVENHTEHLKNRSHLE